MKLKVGMLVKRRSHYNGEHRAFDEVISGNIHAGDVRRITGIKYNETTGTGIRVFVEGGIYTGYCAGWFEPCPEENIKKILEYYENNPNDC